MLVWPRGCLKGPPFPGSAVDVKKRLQPCIIAAKLITAAATNSMMRMLGRRWCEVTKYPILLKNTRRCQDSKESHAGFV